MTNSHLRLVVPRTVNCTVTPRRPKNAELRTREHLTPDEVERLIELVSSSMSVSKRTARSSIAKPASWVVRASRSEERRVGKEC